MSEHMPITSIIIVKDDDAPGKVNYHCKARGQFINGSKNSYEAALNVCTSFIIDELANYGE